MTLFVRLGVLIRASASEPRSPLSFAVLIASTTNLTTLRTTMLHGHTLGTLKDGSVSSLKRV